MRKYQPKKKATHQQKFMTADSLTLNSKEKQDFHKAESYSLHVPTFNVKEWPSMDTMKWWI